MKALKIFFLLVIILSSMNFTPIEVTAQSVKILPNYYYRLTTQWQGDNKSLDIVSDGQNDKLILAQTGNYDGQLWRFTALGNGYYRLTTKSQGDGKSLDILNDANKNRPILARTADHSRQKWKITPMGNGYYRLTTQGQGDSKSLDIINDNSKNKPILANTTNASGQMWKISQVRPIHTKPRRTVRNTPPQTSRQELNQELIKARQKRSEEMHQKRIKHNQALKEQREQQNTQTKQNDQPSFLRQEQIGRQQNTPITGVKVVPVGTPLKIKLSPYYFPGDQNSNATLSEAMILNGNLLIPAGTPVSVAIDFHDSNFSPYNGGITDATFTLISVHLDGRVLPVTATPTLLHDFDFPQDPNFNVTSNAAVEVPIDTKIEFNLNQAIILGK